MSCGKEVQAITHTSLSTRSSHESDGTSALSDAGHLFFAILVILLNIDTCLVLPFGLHRHVELKNV